MILKGGETEQGGGKKIKMVDTGEQTSHDMTGIAIIKENTIPMLRMEQALAERKNQPKGRRQRRTNNAIQKRNE